ncbi:MAG: UDP-N-acetylmuramate dehydrogenase [Pseudomonadota bacterium]|nr:UDP-N-acetylmuramate dehydrogenase [Pseudomonadota bacterium]MDO7667627.1 UDP-N-acetylmuramate dehydrogenase [Pseudomonadota bacterium]MDO7711689.1 UDP-N-acetylmuramate dehydrogenase [Pseudomonadota bacterium]
MTTVFQNLRGDLRLNEPLAKHTSWRTGGNANQFYRPEGIKDLAGFLSQLPEDEPLLWLGLGSNLLVRDGGFAGTVISMSGTLQQLTVNGLTVSAEVGVYCAKLAKQAARAGLSGTAFLAGIPGTLGGALAMNAGAHNCETWSIVSNVTTIDRRGVIRVRKPEDFKISYRHVEFPSEEWFVSVTLNLAIGDAVAEAEEIRALLKRRNVSQPTNQPCAGSVFRNPEGDFAGRLIEVCGLKGLTVGGASVSEKHANFIVNEGTATAADIEALILLVQKKVELIQGIKLVTEVHVLGEVA